MLRFLLPFALIMTGLLPASAQDDNLVTLEAVSKAGAFVAHTNKIGVLRLGTADLDPADATFRKVPGLAGGDSVSFESINFPGEYLRHAGFTIYLHRLVDTDLFRADASFVEGPSFALGNPASSFRSVNFPDYYLAVEGNQLFIRPFENSQDYMSRISFYVYPGLAGPKIDPYGGTIKYGPPPNE